MRQWLDWLYPPRCPICDSVEKSAACCSNCVKLVEYVEEPFCYCCGKPLWDAKQEYCGDCMKYPKTFTANRSLAIYNDAMKRSLSRFKYENRRDYALFYAQECAQRFGPELLKLEIDMVIPVPIHRRKKRERGYNQAAIFGKALSDMLGLSFYEDGLRRTVYTLPQKQLNNLERLKNLEKAFLIGKNSVKLKKVLLVDDIYTTGATLEACSRILITAGAQNVYGLTIATGEGY